jgi:hypothetical protein
MSTSHTNRRLIALGAVMALAAASSLALIDGLHAGPPWVHWVGSLVAVAAAFGTVVIAELSWQRAINTATAAGLVEVDSHT